MRTVLVFLMVALFVPSIVAQTTLGTLQGTALNLSRSPKSPVMPGVQITLTNIETKASFKVVTDESGKFSLQVPEGSYSLKAEMPAYSTYETNLKINQNTKGVYLGMLPTDPKDRMPVGSGVIPLPLAPVRKRPPNQA